MYIKHERTLADDLLALLAMAAAAATVVVVAVLLVITDIYNIFFLLAFTAPYALVYAQRTYMNKH